MYITISGVDNSGKSTIANLLCTYFLSHGKQVVHKKEFDFFFTQFLSYFMKSSKVSEWKNSVIINKKRTLFSQVFYALYFMFVYLHFFFERLLYSTIWREKILIRERYIYDFGISVANNTGCNLYLFLARIFPKSGYNLFLNISLETILKRSSLRSFRFSKEHYKNLLAMYPYFQSKYITLNAEDRIETIVDEILLIYKLKTIKQIAISGIDGAGKSTTIQNLQMKLSQYHVSTYYLHFYYNFLILKLIKLFKKEKQNLSDNYEKSRLHEKESRNVSKSFFWKFLVLFDAYIQYYLSFIFGYNKLKIYDRFFSDFQVSWDFLGLNYNKKIFQRTPKLKNSFILIADPKILYERKPEHTLRFFTQCHQLYHKLSKTYDIVLIDTSYTNQDEVINLIFKTLQ